MPLLNMGCYLNVGLRALPPHIFYLSSHVNDIMMDLNILLPYKAQSRTAIRTHHNPAACASQAPQPCKGQSIMNVTSFGFKIKFLMLHSQVHNVRTLSNESRQENADPLAQLKNTGLLK